MSGMVYLECNTSIPIRHLAEVSLRSTLIIKPTKKVKEKSDIKHRQSLNAEHPRC
jgi:hypothetical protein